MGPEFLQRVKKTTIISAIVLFPIVATYLGIATGVAGLAGCAWSLINLYFISLLVKYVCLPGKTPRLRVTLVFLVKIPVLYAVGAALLAIDTLPLVGLLAGFMWPMVVATLKAMGRLILGLDGKRNSVSDVEALLAKRSS